ncbi:MAG: GNAT family N-acetyltransferase, partial [Anaerolineae bacterium]
LGGLDADRLQYARYRALRMQLPLMPSRYEDPDAILPRLHDLAGLGPGVAAIRRGQLAGFLVAYQFPDFRGKPSTYSPEWANGAALDDSRRIYEALYTAMSAQWVEEGFCAHLLSILASDAEGIEGWRWLGFGLLGADGVCGLQPVTEPTANVDLRRAGLDDLQQVTALMGDLRAYMAKPPTFLHQEDAIGAEEDKEWLADPDHAVWLAYQGTGVVACMVQGPANPRASEIIRDRGTTSIVAAYTRETARNTGIGSALLNQVLAWARAEGYERCAVDWEPMNVLATRFWMRYFQPVSYALVRHVDERFAPTREDAARV